MYLEKDIAKLQNVMQSFRKFTIAKNIDVENLYIKMKKKLSWVEQHFTTPLSCY
jgi:hypothetical protein